MFKEHTIYYLSVRHGRVNGAQVSNSSAGGGGEEVVGTGSNGTNGDKTYQGLQMFTMGHWHLRAHVIGESGRCLYPDGLSHLDQ